MIETEQIGDIFDGAVVDSKVPVTVTGVVDEML